MQQIYHISSPLNCYYLHQGSRFLVYSAIQLYTNYLYNFASVAPYIVRMFIKNISFLDVIANFKRHIGLPLRCYRIHQGLWRTHVSPGPPSETHVILNSNLTKPHSFISPLKLSNLFEILKKAQQ